MAAELGEVDVVACRLGTSALVSACNKVRGQMGWLDCWGGLMLGKRRVDAQDLLLLLSLLPRLLRLLLPLLLLLLLLLLSLLPLLLLLLLLLLPRLCSGSSRGCCTFSCACVLRGLIWDHLEAGHDLAACCTGCTKGLCLQQR